MPAFSFLPPPFRRIYPSRALVLWALLRAGVLFFASVVGNEPARSSIALSGPATVGLVILIGMLADIDARRRDEYVFLANLGVRRATVPLISGTVAAVAELVLRTIPW